MRAPGTATDVTVEGDGAARIEFTPTAPGPVTMRLVDRPGDAVAGPRRGARGRRAAARGRASNPALVRRVVADPSGWALQIPLVQPGGAPGSPVLEIVPLPT